METEDGDRMQIGDGDIQDRDTGWRHRMETEDADMGWRQRMETEVGNRGWR